MNEEDQEFLESLRKDFLEETFDLLVKCEESLLNFESTSDQAYIQEYLRLIHSIKGSARAVEFDSIASTIHLIESLAQGARDHKFIENSLKSLDGLKEGLESAKCKNFGEMEMVISSIVSRIK